MTITSSFSTMLNQYLPDKLFQEELLKRDWLLQNIEHKTDWKGGRHVVPFLSAGATSISFGSLTDATDIAEAEYIRGYEDDQIELWGSLKFNHADLARHDGKIPESTFIRLIPDEVERFMRYFKEAASVQMTSGPHFALATDSTDAATGKFVVDHVERFQIGQKCAIDDDDTGSTDNAYVIGIDVNTATVTFSDTRGGSAFNFSAYTAAQNAKFYHPGIATGTGTQNTYNSIKSVLLSSTNGGDATIHNKTKATYPHLQAYNIDGSAVSASNILEKLFDSFTDIRKVGKGNASKFLMSFKHLGSILKALQVAKGGYKVVKEPDGKTNLYGWSEIGIADLATGQTLDVVGIQEMDNSEIFMLDMNSFYLASNGGVKKRKGPDGREWYEVRATTGYYYIVDVNLDSNLICKAPGHNGIIHSISY